MNPIEKIVLPFAMSQTLTKHWVWLDTAFIWVMPMKLLGEDRPLPYLIETERKNEVQNHFDFIPAPVLSELMDAIDIAANLTVPPTISEKMTTLAHALIVLHDEKKP